jgi:integrase
MEKSVTLTNATTKTRLRLSPMAPKKEKNKIRSQHEGTVEVTRTGKYRVRGMVGGERVSTPSMPTEKQAKSTYRELVKATKDRQNGKVQRIIPLFGDYVFDTLDGPYREFVATGTLAAATWELYEMIYRTNIADHPIAAMPLNQIRASDFEKWSASLTTQPRYKVENGKKLLTKPAGPMNPNTKSRYLGMLQGIMERARKDRLIDHNPVKDATKPTYQESEFRILTAPEIERLIDLAREQDLETDRFLSPSDRGKLLGRMEMVILLGIHGIGPAEMCGLTPDHWDGQFLEISQQSKRGKVSSRMKTTRRKGVIPISDPDLAQFLDQSAGRKFILPTLTGNPWSEDGMRRIFITMVQDTEFHNLRPYDLRHTAAMRMLEEGTDVRTVAEILRNSPEVILTRYAKSRDELKRKATGSIRRLRIAN